MKRDLRASRISVAVSGPQNFAARCVALYRKYQLIPAAKKATVTIPMITSLPEMPVAEGGLLSAESMRRLLSVCELQYTGSMVRALSRRVVIPAGMNPAARFQVRTLAPSTKHG